MATENSHVEQLYERTKERNQGLLERILRRLEAIRDDGDEKPESFEDEFGGDPGPEPPTQPSGRRK